MTHKSINVTNCFQGSTDKEEVWFRETIEENFDPILHDIEKETLRWSKSKREARIKRAEKSKKKSKKKNRKREKVDKNFDELLDVIRREQFPMRTKAEIERAAKIEADFLANLDKKDEKSESSSSENEPEEPKAPESPGKWEIMPGSSATRPQELISTVYC